MAPGIVGFFAVVVSISGLPGSNCTSCSVSMVVPPGTPVGVGVFTASRR
jgi:hypothetical protein